MNLEKLFWSKAKIDIIKYLIFRRQGISMRALETELWWTFPAIKKQVDSLEEAEIISVIREQSGRSISLKPAFAPILKELFFLALQSEISKHFEANKNRIQTYYRGDKFGKPIGMDIIIIYSQHEKQAIEDLKKQISEIFRGYRIESVSIVFMSAEDREKRYRLADRFVLQVMRHYKNIDHN